MVRRILLPGLVVVGVVAGAWNSESAVSDAASKRCAPDGASKVFKENASAQVYRPARGLYRWGLLGCLRGQRLRYDLDAGDTFYRVPLIALRGRAVAVVGTCEVECEPYSITSVTSSLLVGHDSCSGWPRPTCSPPESVSETIDGNGFVGSLDTRGDGSLAWSVCLRPRGNESYRPRCGRATRGWRKEIWAERAGTPRRRGATLLAAGKRVAAHSIRIRGSVVEWRQAGKLQTRSFPLARSAGR